MTMSLKLLVNKQDHKIVYAEVHKDFVDFLFYILTLPIGAITKLFAKEPLSGSLGYLYKSINNLKWIYILPNKTKDIALNPKSSIDVPCQDLLMIPTELPPIDTTLYRCNRGCGYVTDVLKVICPGCSNVMSKELIYTPKQTVKATVGEVGFVKGVVTYMVMDDLTVKPMSTISSITLLNKLSIKDICVLEEKEVQFGTEEGLKLLKASLVCKNVLTCTFLDTKDQVEII
ncbi:hypothetical protein QVD17_31389 [Tagetes erecta]|uniref:DUF674 domain-containing protein n=1 Tax=Tagetes erecta TaxID=13708 RepID=A0AAD8NP57_TARER|nr:hypothetical protein QVD17_31389 [Tagetes erecta]